MVEQKIREFVNYQQLIFQQIARCNETRQLEEKRQFMSAVEGLKSMWLPYATEPCNKKLKEYIDKYKELGESQYAKSVFTILMADMAEKGILLSQLNTYSS
jgi:hypothetical protein